DRQLRHRLVRSVHLGLQEPLHADRRQTAGAGQLRVGRHLLADHQFDHRPDHPALRLTGHRRESGPAVIRRPRSLGVARQWLPARRRSRSVTRMAAPAASSKPAMPSGTAVLTPVLGSGALAAAAGVVVVVTAATGAAVVVVVVVVVTLVGGALTVVVVV